MTNGWFLWYGLRIGLSYDMAMCLPFGELADLIAMEQIRNEGAKKKKSRKAEENSSFGMAKEQRAVKATTITTMGLTTLADTAD